MTGDIRQTSELPTPPVSPGEPEALRDPCTLVIARHPALDLDGEPAELWTWREPAEGEA